MGKNDPLMALAGLVPTEGVNLATQDIDQLATVDVLTRINTEDQQVPQAIYPVISAIGQVVDQTVQAISRGGRLFYFGAGTSGRLGVLDAAECPPTYGTDPALVQAFIAGGDPALRHAIEGAEDSTDQGRSDFLETGARKDDVVIGISASGGAPYVVSAMKAARETGCFTAGITASKMSALAQAVDCPIVVETGPEVITGSTRMKAGTAQKLVLNMITTATMIQLGKTYGNFMVDVKPTNAKLIQRAQRLVSVLASVEMDQARQTLEACGYEVKTAVVMLRCQLNSSEAKERLTLCGGKLRVALSPC